MAALSALRTRLKVKLTDQNTRILTNAQLDTLLNEALEMWVDETEELYQEDAFDVVAKQFNYDAPADILAIKYASWGPASYSPIEPVGYTEFQEGGGLQLNAGNGVPSMVMLEGSNSSNNPTDLRYRIWPPPSATSTSTTLSGAITAGTVSISIVSTSGWRTRGWALVDSEKFYYQDLDTSTKQLKLCRRGQGNTTAASHSSGATIKQCDVILKYTRRPAALSSDADVPEINQRFHKYLLNYALAEALELDGRPEQAETFRKQWEKAIAQGRRHIRSLIAHSPFYQLQSPY